jgi:hypothetical protein
MLAFGSYYLGPARAAKRGLHGMGVVTVHERDRTYGRRLGAIAGLAILLHAAAMLVPVPHRPSVTPGPGVGPFAGLALLDVVMGSAGAPGAPAATPAAATAVAAPEVRLVPADSPAEAPAVALPAPSATSAGGAGASSDSASAGAGAMNGAGASGGGGGGSSEPVEMALRPRVYVHPRTPTQLIAKRKIDDFVLLRARVGPDGQVREVEVLRSISNCEECTASAVEAAKQSVFEPPVVGGRPAEVWTNPFEVRFSYRH